MMTHRYRVGIDLGTTHTIVAYAEVGEDAISLLPIPQWVGHAQSQVLTHLPSVQYHVAKGEMTEAELAATTALLDGLEHAPGVIDLHSIIWGEWASRLGSSTQGRLVVSAKSWLSVVTKQQEVPLLPCPAAPDVHRISAIDVCASYLFYIRLVWNQSFPDAPLDQQAIALTLPASFGHQARHYTLEAAKRAGLHTIQLLEEPQSAFYHWYWQRKQDLASHFKNIRTILVCDIGGGTTDFSLIQVDHGAVQGLELERVAVGDHLMLGGDNMDQQLVLQLQHIQQQQDPTSTQRRWSKTLLSQMTQVCRRVKEQALSGSSTEMIRVQLAQSGAQLIQNTWQYDWPTQQICDTIIEGFFPSVSIEEPVHTSQQALAAYGLPYASDPAITRHLASFLRHHCPPDTMSLDAVLYNGGVMQSELLQQRMTQQLTQWYSDTPKVLNVAQPDIPAECANAKADTEQAVALGAVVWQMIQAGDGVAIDSGVSVIKANAARGYYLQLETVDSVAKVICILPKGTAADQWQALSQRRFLLKIGQPVSFKLWHSSIVEQEHLGAQRVLDLTEFHALPSVYTNLSEVSQADMIEVTLEACLTELGLLQLKLLTQAGQVWHLEFATDVKQRPSVDAETKAIFDDSLKTSETRVVKQLKNELENRYGSWHQWPLPQIRSWVDILLSCKKSRFRSAEHERVWLQLVGFCLRPGLGDSQDAERLNKVFPLFHQGVCFSKSVANWKAWWTFWRRLSCGLTEQQQLACYQQVAPMLSNKAWQSRQLQQKQSQQGFDELLRFVACLEYLAEGDRQALGETLLANIKKMPNMLPSVAWSIGRLGSRRLTNRSNAPLAPKMVESWIKTLLTFNWRKIPDFGLAAVMMAQPAQQPRDDIAQSVRDQVCRQLEQAKAPPAWLALLDVNISNRQSAQQQWAHLLGESVPLGLVEV